MTQEIPTVYQDRKVYIFKSSRLNCNVPVEANSLESALFRARKTDKDLGLRNLVGGDKARD